MVAGRLASRCKLLPPQRRQSHADFAAAENINLKHCAGRSALAGAKPPHKYEL